MGFMNQLITGGHHPVKEGTPIAEWIIMESPIYK